MSDGQSNNDAGRDLIFVAKRRITLQIVGCIVVGASFLGMVALTTILSAFVPATPERKIEPGLNSWFVPLIALSIIGTFALLRAFFLLRMPRQVIVYGGGVQIEGLFSQRQLPWSDIGGIARDTRSSPYAGKVQILEIKNRDGKRRAVIADTLEGFEVLAAELIRRSSVIGGQPTFDAQRNEDHNVAKASRRIRWIAWGFLLFALGMAAGLVAGINEELHTRRFATEGVTTDAKIVRAYMYNVTPHVEFSFQDEKGHAFSRDAMMYQGPDWEAARASKTISVVYLRSAPDWNHLVAGEETAAQFGGSFIFLSAGGLVMFGLLSIFAFMGYDFKSEDGKNKLMRHGRVIKEWGASSKFVSPPDLPPPPSC